MFIYPMRKWFSPKAFGKRKNAESKKKKGREAPETEFLPPKTGREAKKP
jgi:hypothetical protein